ncbi:MAG: autotransporter domain-containing protein, partial [Desulfobulbaceae bacterium]|nr:autotransporter domain-containing protein [Desulfobulbaceae bacterium]
AALDCYRTRGDLLLVSGNDRVAGTVALNTLHPEELMPGDHTVVIISGQGGLSDAGVSLAVRPSAVVDYVLFTPDIKSLAVGLKIDFSPMGLTVNQGAIGDYFNAMQLAGGSDSMDPHVRYLFYLTDTEELAYTYGQLIPDYYDNFTQTTLLVTKQFALPLKSRLSTIHSFGKIPESLTEAERFFFRQPVRLAYNGSNAGLASLLNGSANSYSSYGMWINASGFQGREDTVDDFTGYDFDSRNISGGLDFMLTGNVLVGGAIGRTTSTVEVYDSHGAGDIDSVFAALYASYFTDSYYLDTMAFYGRHDYDNIRNILAFDQPLQTSSDHDGYSLSAYGEGGYNFRFGGDWVLQPFTALQYIYLKESGFETNGADELNLVMEDRSSESLTFDLGARLNKGFKIPAGIIAPEVSASWNYDFGLDDQQLTASFAGYRAASFSIIGREEDRQGLEWSAGLRFFSKSGFSSSLRYIEQHREHSRVGSIIGELRLEF